MGELVSKTPRRTAAVTFTKRGSSYRATVRLSHLYLLPGDPSEALSAASNSYARAIHDIKAWKSQTAVLRTRGIPITARRAWALGEIVHTLREELSAQSCSLDGLYDHLRRHAGTSEWLQNYMTFRRYVDDPARISGELMWRGISKRPKVAGQAILAAAGAES